ncbi:MAG: Sir2 family NAD-dependent protein deacetylase [Acidimicrobiia bacterium]|nr:Sir2 family NAD-dependent protein deacetylase [Acidimicrobiia bacterium]
MTEIADVVALLRGRTRILVFTGAGISTDSGIPDFRGSHGLWTKLDPDDFTIERYLGDPQVRRRSWANRATTGFLDARPNAAHRAVVRLWEAGVMIGCVTQNIDGLHAAAGLPHEAVVELHGSAATTSCVRCHASQPTRDVTDRVARGDTDPACMRCGGILKTDVVMFGERLPDQALTRALEMADDADAVLAVGTTLGVFPAASVPLRVSERGMPFLIVNRGPTDLDDLADLVLDGEATPALEGLVSELV